jgi:hypothetical protein
MINNLTIINLRLRSGGEKVTLSAISNIQPDASFQPQNDNELCKK